jgi:hypothetical protein
MTAKARPGPLSVCFQKQWKYTSLAGRQAVNLSDDGRLHEIRWCRNITRDAPLNSTCNSTIDTKTPPPPEIELCLSEFDARHIHTYNPLGLTCGKIHLHGLRSWIGLVTRELRRPLRRVSSRTSSDVVQTEKANSRSIRVQSTCSYTSSLRPRTLVV